MIPGNTLPPVLHRPRNQKKKNWTFFAKYYWNRDLVNIIATQGLPQYSHRSVCVFRTEAPGRRSTQTRTQASPAVAESEDRLAIGFLVVDDSGPAGADNEFAYSVMRQLRRPIRPCSRQISRWLSTTKSRRTLPVSSHIAKERLAGWCILGSTLQLLQSVWVECPKKRRKLRYVSYGTTWLFLGCTNPKKQKKCHDSYTYVLVQQ